MKTFSAFWRACGAAEPPAMPVAPPHRLQPPRVRPTSLPAEELGLLPRPDWARGLGDTWTPGEHGAHDALDAFLNTGLAEYPHGRDLPAVRGTSRLSPHLHFGEISPRDVWHAVRECMETAAVGPRDAAGEVYLRQLGWREFSHYLLVHSTHTPEKPLRPEFEAFPWLEDPKGLEAWRRGMTGVPFVDAGMRELWQTGWMHNRVRMVVASFLVKDLLVPWREGATWFWDTLVDADLANNTQGWQWTAGCGADAAPYFRIFNPVLQGRRFDADGAYVRRWAPELDRLPARFVHRPWEASGDMLREAGVKLIAVREKGGSDVEGAYPLPLVDHAYARERALAAFRDIRARTAEASP